MQKRGSKCIDLITMTALLLDYVNEIIITEVNEIINSDHRGYLLDVDLEGYF